MNECVPKNSKFKKKSIWFIKLKFQLLPVDVRIGAYINIRSMTQSAIILYMAPRLHSRFYLLSTQHFRNSVDDICFLNFILEQT